jgi:hypothetical protein
VLIGSSDASLTRSAPAMAKLRWSYATENYVLASLGRRRRGAFRRL